MIEQLKTIRDGLENFTEPYLQKALTALTQLEAMAGSQEPKFWYRPVGDDGLYEGPVHHNSIGGKMLRDEKPGEWVPLFEGAAPVAQQYEAGDMASAAAQGFRDGVASVAQPQEPVAYYYQKHNCFGQLVWNVGFVAPRDATYCYPLYTAAPVAQQPQVDSLESLLSTAIGLLMGYEDRDGKGGTRNPYKPGSAVANFVAECVERLKDWPMTDSTQQPQAGAVSDDLRDRLVAISQAIADQDDRAAQAMIREILAAPQQAEASWLTDSKQTIERQFAEFLNDRRSMNVSAVFHEVVRKFSELAAPQQAEAVPETNNEAKVRQVEALLDAFIERDPDRAERVMEATLAQIALRKRLHAKKEAGHE